MPTTPEVRVERASSLCSLGMRPLLMTGFLRQLLMEHFAEKDQIEDRSLEDYLWTSGASSNILIESITRWTPDQAGGRPALIIKRNGWRVERRGINDQIMGIPSIDGFDNYATFMSGSHTIFCLARAGAECEKLAAEVYRHLVAFSSYIRRELDLHRFAVAEIGPLSGLEESAGHYAVALTISYAHEETWTIKPHAPKLKRIVLQTFEP